MTTLALLNLVPELQHLKIGKSVTYLGDAELNSVYPFIFKKCTFGKSCLGQNE